jgi:hypothetical protein
MIALEDAVLVLKGWKGRRLRVKFEGVGIRELHAKCELFGIGAAGASFALNEDFAFEVDFSGCFAEYGEPRSGEDTGGAESALIFRRGDLSLVVMLLPENE